jgi:hypothetical protein
MVKKIKKTGKLNEEGYVNVANQLGISTERGWWLLSGYGEAGWSLANIISRHQYIFAVVVWAFEELSSPTLLDQTLCGVASAVGDVRHATSASLLG